MFIFLIETISLGELESLRTNLGCEGLFSVDSRSRSGGLALFWKKDATVNLLSFSYHHIDV